MDSEQVREFHLNRWLFALGAGVALLLAESLSALNFNYYIYIPSLPLFMVPSLIGIAGIYIASALGFYRAPAKKTFLASMAGFVIYMTILLFLAKWGSSKLQAIGLPLFIIVVLFVLYLMEFRLRVLSGLSQAGLFMLIFILWCWVSPEVRVFGGDDRFWVWFVHFIALGLIITLGYRGICIAGLKPRWPGSGFVLGVLLVFILGASAWHTGDRMSPLDSYEPVEMAAGMRSHPNTVVVVLDTLRKDHLSIYGYERETCPFLKDCSKQCQVFTSAVSVSPWTIPSHASLFTGLFPRSHGAHIFLPKSWKGIPPVYSYPLGPQFTTLAEIFRKQGFATGAVVANSWAVSKMYGFDQGFEYFDHGLEEKIIFARTDFIELLACQVFDIPPPDIPYMFAHEVTARALDWTRQRGDKSFFLFLNYMETHRPYISPPPFRDAFPGRRKGMFYTVESYIEPRKRIMSGESLLPYEKEHLISQYDGSIVYFDESFKKLIQGLRQQGLLENTYIYFLSDHGESFGDHKLFQHSNDVYENEIAMPLVICHPNRSKTGRVDEPVFTVDLFPTILLNAGICPPESVEGVPIRGALQDGTYLTERPFIPLAELYYTNWGWLFSRFGDRFRRIRRAVYQDGFKIIVSTDGRHELYDLESDPGELNNIVSSRPGLLEEARIKVNDYLDKTVEPPPAAWPDLDQETIELMRSLGYLR